MVTTHKSQVEILKSKLPKDYARIIMEKCNVTRKTVYNILYSWDINSPVLQALIELAEVHQEKLREIDRRLEKLTGQ